MSLVNSSTTMVAIQFQIVAAFTSKTEQHLPESSIS